MNITLKRTRAIGEKEAVLYITDKNTPLDSLGLTAEALDFLKKLFEQKQHYVTFNNAGRFVFVAQVEPKEEELYKIKEGFRLIGVKAGKSANGNKIKSLAIQNFSTQDDAALLAAEGMALANYQFLKYKEKPEEEENALTTIKFLQSEVTKKSVDHLQNLVDAVYACRTLVNEPLNFLTAPQISKEFQKMGKKAGFKVTVFDKKRIQKENMNGILAVNLGSPDPPTFTIMEWKPKNAQNKQPIIIVGKGVVFDTGGLSLKPTTNSMDIMKCDMAGGATVGGVLYTVAKNKIPLHVIGLVPATDNRPGQNAYVPGDVIRMRNGLSVEIMNTDAEGRMLLADALNYATKYKPELVIDLATLTGAAMRSIGPHAIALMSKADRETTDALVASGYNTHERLIEFPLWDEYGDMIKSDIADIKNLGGALSGAITAGKFLEHFTDYPWMHLDIAPTAWNFRPDGYRLKNGTGSGVRLLVDFLVNRLK